MSSRNAWVNKFFLRLGPARLQPLLHEVVEDAHSEDAKKWAEQDSAHLISPLSYSETLAVLSRIRREKRIATVPFKSAMGTLQNGPWRALHLDPEWQNVQRLSGRWGLRGADLWHPATAIHIPEVLLLTYDGKLESATHGEGITGK
jgi:predicted nucleic acid-binding protein